MNPTIQETLLDLFHQVIEDPDRMHAVPIDAWQEGSEERQLLTGFRGVLERLQQSKQQAEQQLREQELAALDALVVDYKRSEGVMNEAPTCSSQNIRDTVSLKSSGGKLVS